MTAKWKDPRTLFWVNAIAATLNLFMLILDLLVFTVTGIVISSAALLICGGAAEVWRRKIPPRESRHDVCLREIARLERELGITAAMTAAEFDREVSRAVATAQGMRPFPDSDDPAYWQEFAFSVWRNYLTYLNAR